MITQRYLFDKYNTGTIYINPAAVEYEDAIIRSYYWCSGSAEDVLDDYNEHLSSISTDRCNEFKIIDDGVLRCGDVHLVENEKEWLWVDYKLRHALRNNVTSDEKVRFIVLKGDY